MTTSDRPWRVDTFCELIANFYSLKTKKLPAGRLVLGDWLGHYRLFTGLVSLPYWESRSLLLMTKGSSAAVTKVLI